MSSELGAGSAAALKAAVLADALPYIRRFWGKIVVVKYGGNAIGDSETMHGFAQDVVLMRSVGMRPVVVHGGGPQISEMMRRLGKSPEFVEGRRVTDAETLDIARMVLVGSVNRDIVASINVLAPWAVGLSGEDAGLITASARSPELGFVGDVEEVNASIIDRLLAQDLIPVIATIGTDDEGQAYNINADTAAGAIAEALHAEKLVYLTDIEGIRRDRDDAATLISTIGCDELDKLIADGIVNEGMIPKVELVRAGRQGRRRSRPHPRRSSSPCAAARDLHPRGNRNDGVTMTDRYDVLMNTYPPPTRDLRAPVKAVG